MMTAAAYPTKSKEERIHHLREARTMAIRGGLRTQNIALQRACTAASHALSQIIGRVLVMASEDEVRAALNGLPNVLSVKQLALAMRTYPADMKAAGLEGIDWHLAFAESDT